MLLDDNSIWRDIRNNVSCSDVAERYSMGMNKKGFMLCPFHNDSRPSLKVYNGTERDEHSGFYCFSCGKHGSVIDLVSGYYSISLREAADMIARDYSISKEIARSGTTPPKPKINFAKQFEKDTLHWLRITCDLYHILAEQLEECFQRLDKLTIGENVPLEEQCSQLCDQVSRLEEITRILSEGESTERMQLLLNGKGELGSYERQLSKLTRTAQKAV